MNQRQRELIANLMARVIALQDEGYFVTFTYHTETDGTTYHEPCAVVQVYRSHSDFFHDGKPLLTLMPFGSQFDLARQQIDRFLRCNNNQPTEDTP